MNGQIAPSIMPNALVIAPPTNQVNAPNVGAIKNALPTALANLDMDKAKLYLARHSNEDQGAGNVPVVRTNNIEELLLELALSGADAKTLMLARQILECNEMIGGNLEKINELNDKRQAYADRKAMLALFKAHVHRNEGGKDGLASGKELAKNMANFLDNNPRIDAEFPGLRAQLSLANSGTGDAYLEIVKGTICARQAMNDDGKLERDPEGGSFISGDRFSIDALDAHIVEIDNAMQKLDQAKELINIRNQQALQLKQRTLTLVSNFNQADHEGQKAVISNTRA
ncbi:MAG: hypothetical protein JRH20_18440 [Deltaproteobacteria bacterium]|nr:hypothetical protein [Deltaproteobacteria bacterium]